MIREVLNDHEDIFWFIPWFIFNYSVFGSIIVSFYPQNDAAYVQSSWTSW